MNYVNVSGGKPYQRKRVQEMVHYCINKLMPRMQTLDIEIKLKDLKGDALGYCLSEDTRTFDLEIDKKQNLRKLLLTVAHEMVHVKQYVRKEMDDWNGVAVARWKGGTVLPNTSYYDLPWEKEAYRLQAKLAKECWNKEIF